MPVPFIPVVPGRGGTFPDGQLGVEVEILTGGTWTPITGYVSQPVTITRGRADGQQQAGPSTAPMQWANIDGRFSPRNPLGPYYGQLGRNTPVRISIPADATHLWLPYNDGSLCKAQSTTALAGAGDLDIRIDVELEDSTPAALITRYADASTGRSWAITLESDGTMALSWWPDSITQIKAATSIPVPLGRIAFRATLTLSSGLITFYTAPDIGGTWTQFGSAFSAGATSVYHSSSTIRIGGNADLAAYGYGSAQGRVYAASIAIAGTTVASPDFTAAVAGGATLTDAQGNIWAVSGTAEFSDRDYRFSGECAALPQQWQREDVWTAVSAAGVLRRINQNNAPLDSAIKRGYLRMSGVTAPVAYWPAEDLANSQSIAAAIGGQVMEVNGPAQFASSSVFVCSNSIPSLNGSSWSAYVPRYNGGQDIVARFLMNVPSGGEADGSKIFRIHTSGDVRTFTLIYHTGGALQVVGYDVSGNTLFDSGPVAFGVDGEFLRVSMELRTGHANSSNVNWSIVTMRPGSTSGLAFTGTLTNTNLGHAKNVFVNPDGALMSTAIGHMSVQATWDSLFDLAAELDAYRGETAANRFSRLCAEENVNCRIYGAPDLSVLMGAQGVNSLYGLLAECEGADNGMMFEPLDITGLGYRTSGSMCSQSPGALLDYSLDQVSPPLAPTDDDQYTQNDVTASRPTGSSARVVLDDGSPMSISPPPLGVGSYAVSVTANVWEDTQLGDVANWLLHLGTTNEERYPSIVVDLTDRAMSTLFYPVLGTRLGDMTQITDLPSFLPPDDVKAIVWGQSEVLGDFVCNTTWQTQPESPYEVLIAGSGAVTDCRADTDGSSLGASITATVTSFPVATDAGNAVWTTVPGDWPFDILVGGERMTVTGISGASSPQTFTVTRSVNGIVKTHSAGESVSLFSPVYIALA
jgi:hypothetical protein